MTDSLQKIGRIFVLAFLMFFAATIVFGSLAAIGVVAAVAVGPQVAFVIVLIAVLPVLAGAVIFIRRLARTTTEEPRKPFHKKHSARPRPNGDMSDVAGIPYRDPWLG